MLYRCDPWTMEVKLFLTKFSVSVSVTRHVQNKTIKTFMYVIMGPIKARVQNVVSRSYMHAIFELVAHELLEIWTVLSHSFTKGDLLHLPGYWSLYHGAWVYERRRHSAQIPCTEAEPLKPGYIHVP